MPRFRVSDSSLNSYGFRVISEGGDITNFLKNPIMLWMHTRYMFDGDPLPIGKWENLKLENGTWEADPVLDEKDPFALKIKDKVDAGIINMASIGIRMLEFSEDPSVLVPGQTRPTVTKWELQEISLVDIGANKNAVRLFNRDGVEITLADGQDNPMLPTLNSIKMKSIALKLGLAEAATEDQIILKAGELLTRIADLEKSNNDLKLELKKASDEKCAALVDEAISQKKITADKREAFLKMAAADFENAKAVLSSIPPQKKPSQMIGKDGSPETKPDDWKTLMDQGSEAVEKFRAENPEEYKKMYRKNYGVDPVI